MESSQQQEKKNKKIGIIVSVTVHGLLLLIFAFLLAWKEPNPPIPEYGIELNFGIDATGSGQTQPESVAEVSENSVEAQPEEEAEVSEAVNEVNEEMAETETAETSSEVAEEAALSSIASPDVRKEETARVVEPAPVQKEKVAELKKEVAPEKKVAPAEVKKETAEKSSSGVPSDKEVKSINQGDKASTQGDKGSKEGTVDARALYGTPGGGGGASLDMAGWAWEEVPRPKDTSDESGRLVFEITVDDTGEVIGIKTMERGVSAAVEAIYKAEVAKLYFQRNPPDSPAPPKSTGKITFIIKSR